MTGEFEHNLDAKGRLFIPARMREELGEVFYVTLSMDKCLSAYSGESWQNFTDKVNAMPYVKQRKMRLDKNVTVVGCNNHAEFWDSDAWAAINAVETTPENIAAVMEELEF